MLSYEETAELLKQAKQGDDYAKSQLIVHNMPLIKSIARRYRNKQIDYDDLLQLGSLGLIKAINNFDDKYNVKFSTYAVPMIAGEIKRFIRDDGAVKVSRALKSLSGHIQAYINEFTAENTRTPTIDEIAEKFGIERQEAVFAMDSGKFPVSLFEKFGDEGNSQCVMDKITSGEDSDDVVDKILLKQVISKLPERERAVIILRYYRDKTQSEIAVLMGVSQVQISRIEAKVIEKLKAEFGED